MKKDDTYTIFLNQAAYREFESECNFNQLGYNDMMEALLKMYRKHVTKNKEGEIVYR